MQTPPGGRAAGERQARQNQPILRTGKDSCLTIPGLVPQCPKAQSSTHEGLPNKRSVWLAVTGEALALAPARLRVLFFSYSFLVFCFPSTPDCLLFHLYFLNPFSG